MEDHRASPISRKRLTSETYGTLTEGKLLSGIVGHNICLDYFGSPSVEEAKLGLSQHGEAPWSKWTKIHLWQTQQKLLLEMSVQLPVAGLRFSREIELRRDEASCLFQGNRSQPTQGPIIFFTGPSTLPWARNFFRRRILRLLSPAPGRSPIPMDMTKAEPYLLRIRIYLAKCSVAGWRKYDLTRPFLCQRVWGLWSPSLWIRKRIWVLWPPSIKARTSHCLLFQAE